MWSFLAGVLVYDTDGKRPGYSRDLIVKLLWQICDVAGGMTVCIASEVKGAESPSSCLHVHLACI